MNLKLEEVLHSPFANHAMLTHWWRKLSACWCKHPNICLTRGIKSSFGCQLWYDTTFAKAIIVTIIPQEKAGCETRFARIGSTMMTSTKVWIPFVVNIMSICHHDDRRDGAKRTWICLCETWNPTSLVIGQKNLELHHVWQCALLHEHNKVNVSMLNLWVGHICIEKNHEP